MYWSLFKQILKKISAKKKKKSWNGQETKDENVG